MTDERRRLIESLRKCGSDDLDCSGCIMREQRHIQKQNDGAYTTCYDDLMKLAADELERNCLKEEKKNDAE